MAYVIFALSIIVIYVALATLLHLQFGVTGIVNFGVVGFWGFGMYAFAVLLLQYNFPYAVALIVATVLTAALALALGKIILDLDAQSILVATLAFATIVMHLVTTEKWLTRGVIGLGSVPFPINIGRYSDLLFFVLLIVLTAGIILYAYKLGSSPYGRLLASIQDNETLSQSLGKSTTREKLIFFTVTSGLIGFFGALNASINHFLVPRMVSPGLTFVIWIALILGGRRRVLGGLVGVAVTAGIFDFLIETYLPITPQHAQLVPVIKLMIYGLMLLLVLMFRPLGILGAKKKS